MKLYEMGIRVTVERMASGEICVSASTQRGRGGSVCSRSLPPEADECRMRVAGALCVYDLVHGRLCDIEIPQASPCSECGGARRVFWPAAGLMQDCPGCKHA